MVKRAHETGSGQAGGGKSSNPGGPMRLTPPRTRLHHPCDRCRADLDVIPNPVE